jgi:hypothetical protein
VERDSRVISALRLQQSDNVAVDAKPSMVVCVLVDSCNCLGHAKNNLREFNCDVQAAIAGYIKQLHDCHCKDSQVGTVFSTPSGVVVSRRFVHCDEICANGGSHASDYVDALFDIEDELRGEGACVGGTGMGFENALHAAFEMLSNKRRQDLMFAGINKGYAERRRYVLAICSTACKARRRNDAEAHDRMASALHRGMTAFARLKVPTNKRNRGNFERPVADWLANFYTHASHEDDDVEEEEEDGDGGGE